MKELLNQLKEKFPREIEFVISNFARLFSKRNILLCGEVQSGKTLMMIILAMCFIERGKDVIVLLRPRRADKKQFRARFKSVAGSRDITLELCREDNIEKIFKKCSSLSNTVLFVDEADLRRNVGNFGKLCDSVYKYIFVSATPQDLLVTEEWDFTNKSLIHLEPSMSYKGIHDVNFVEVDAYGDALRKIAACPQPEGMPKIILITPVDTTLDAIHDTANNMRQTRMFDVVVTYTGEGIGFDNTRPVHWSISELFKRLSEAPRKPRSVVIVAGNLASRGINFSNYELGWHITHQILFKSERTSSSTAIQACRILGVYEDSNPLYLYSNRRTLDKILNGYELTRDILEEFNTIKKEAYTSELCSTTCLKLDEIPEQYLARTSAKYTFQLVTSGSIVEKRKLRDKLVLGQAFFKFREHKTYERNLFNFVAAYIA